MARDIEIQIGRVATKLRTLRLSSNATVEDALEAASEELGLDIKETEEVVINGDTADYQSRLSNNDTVMFVRGVAGGK